MNRKLGPLGQVLQAISSMLDGNPQILELAVRDFHFKKATQGIGGRTGMTVEQVLRSAIAKHLFDVSYRNFAGLLLDCPSLRSFCRMAWDEVPNFRSLNGNIKVISEDTWQEINTIVVQEALKLGIDNGKWVRADTTGVESNIHHPTDSSLLKDCTRVLTRNQHKVADHFSNIPRIRKRNGVVGKIHFKLVNSRGKDKKRILYQKLIGHVEEIIEQCRETIEILKDKPGGISPYEEGVFLSPLADCLALADGVVFQTRERVLEGRKVSADQKILSIFEPHTDILEKGSREPMFGHKILLAAGKSGLIFNCEVLAGNPSDSSLFLPMIEKVGKIIGKTPTHMAVDDGFASYDNATLAMITGVKELAFGGKLLYEEEAWVSSRRKQKVLRKFRAGIEGIISAFKRGLGLSRCPWKGWDGFQRYITSTVVAWNLRLIGLKILGT